MSEATQKKNGMAVAAMVLGIISLALFWTGTIGAICGVLAIIFAIVAKNKIKADADLAHTGGKAKGGLIMGIIGMILSIVWIIMIMMAANALANELQDRADAFENQDMQELLDNL